MHAMVLSTYLFHGLEGTEVASVFVALGERKVKAASHCFSHATCIC